MTEGALVDCTGAGIAINVNSGFSMTKAESIFVNRKGDTMHGDLNMNSHKIINIPDPDDDLDVVNKEYVDGLTKNNKDEFHKANIEIMNRQEHFKKEMTHTVREKFSEVEDASNIKRGVLVKERIPERMNKIKTPVLSTDLILLNHGAIKNLGGPVDDRDAVNLEYLKSFPQIKYIEVNIAQNSEKDGKSTNLQSNGSANIYKINEIYRIHKDGRINKKKNEKSLPKLYIILSTTKQNGNLWFNYNFVDFQTDEYGLILYNSGALFGKFIISYVEYEKLSDKIQTATNLGFVEIDKETYGLLS